jgi:hypothetical protein
MDFTTFIFFLNLVVNKKAIAKCTNFNQNIIQNFLHFLTWSSYRYWFLKKTKPAQGTTMKVHYTYFIIINSNSKFTEKFRKWIQFQKAFINNFDNLFKRQTLEIEKKIFFFVSSGGETKNFYVFFFLLFLSQLLEGIQDGKKCIMTLEISLILSGHVR